MACYGDEVWFGTSYGIAGVDREFDFAGGQKTEEIILCQTSDTQPFPHFQSAEPYPAPSPLLICRQITQSKSENQAKSL